MFLEVGEETFSYAFKRITQPGFSALYSSKVGGGPSSDPQFEDEDSEEEEEINGSAFDFVQVPTDSCCHMQGEELEIANVATREGLTTAPGYLTESELIGLMEKNGIGTDASIPVHIANIVERNYVTLGAHRYTEYLSLPVGTLIPTKLGIVLIHGYYYIDPELVLPTVRGNIEKECTLIAQGKARLEDVVEHSLQVFKEKFVFFKENIAVGDLN